MSSETKWTGRGKGTKLGNRILVKLVSFTGPFPAHSIVLIAALRYTLFDKPAIKAIKIFRKNIGLKSTNFFQLHKHFCAFGFSLVDKFTLLATKKPSFKYTCINEDMIQNILDTKRKGAILLSAHIGSWEIAGNLLTNRNRTPINAIILDNEVDELKEVYKEALENREFNIIKVSANGLDLMLPVKKALENNEIICMAGDRVLGDGSEKVSFFNKSANFPAGPFLIAAITKAPIIPVFIVKDRFNHYTFKAFDPIFFDDVTRANRKQMIKDGMNKFISNIEEVVKKHPYQWFNFYDVWAKNNSADI